MARLHAVGRGGGVRAGALDKGSAVRGEAGVSIDRMHKRGRPGDECTDISSTHRTARSAFGADLNARGPTGVGSGEHGVLRIENL